jgi:hypothetical protein
MNRVDVLNGGCFQRKFFFEEIADFAGRGRRKDIPNSIAYVLSW